MIRVGNDIVDLRGDGAVDRARDTRFVERVFTPCEQRYVDAAPDSTRALWVLWSAKETAFKIVSGVDPGFGFRHRAFDVRPDPPCAAPGDVSPRTGIVHVGSRAIPVTWETTGDFVHCVGWWQRTRSPVRGAGPALRVCAAVSRVSPGLPGILTAAELCSVGSIESTQVRLLAHVLLDRLGLNRVDVIRHARGQELAAPAAVLDGARVPGVSMSLSHDGRFVAAVVAACRHSHSLERSGWYDEDSV